MPAYRSLPPYMSSGYNLYAEFPTGNACFLKKLE
jgi:hypothetical protein